MRATMRRDFRQASAWAFVVAGLFVGIVLGYLKLIDAWPLTIFGIVLTVVFAQVAAFMAFDLKYTAMGKRPIGAVDITYWLTWLVVFLMGPVAWGFIVYSFGQPKTTFYLPLPRRDNDNKETSA